MILTMRTDKPEAELGFYDGDKQKDYVKWQAHKELSSTILKKIAELMDKHSLNKSDISGIVIFKGPGSFTGLRIGATVANSMAYGLSIPVVGETGDDWIDTGLRRLGADNDDKIVVPEYGGEPNITTPRK